MNPVRSDLFENVRVLLVDDDEDDYLIIKRLFKQIPNSPFQMEWRNNFQDALTEIESEKHDIYLIDYRLTGHTGLDILRNAKALERPEPFILLTGVGDIDVELESLRLAASDYLVKSELTSDTLSRSLYYALGRKEIERAKIEELLSLNDSKEEFISIASHQLRTPATAVKQYLGMVIEGFAGELSPKQNDLLKRAYDNNERQLDIISDLLKVAQIDTGYTKLNIKTNDLTVLLHDSIGDVESVIKERNQLLNVDIPASAPAKIDNELMRMVVDNLLDNASKYTHENGSITLHLHQDNNTWIISVEDNGVGVSHPEKLFEKFSRIKNSLSTKVGGTGLGLYWAQSIVVLHGGKITYSFNDPTGSIFKITIPKDL